MLALLSTFFHWIVFQSIGTPAPIALALWVGLVSQFLPVVGTYLAGILPVLLTFVDSPLNASIIIVFIVVYQQIENYFFAPRITARTMELHPAVAFGAALAGASILGFVGAVLALPAAAMAQAFLSEWGNRYDVVDSHLTVDPAPEEPARVRSAAGDGIDVTRFDDAFAPIAVATRSGLDESLHHGAGAALAADGSLIAHVGDPRLVVYPRSCLKPTAGTRDGRPRPRAAPTICSPWPAPATTEPRCTSMPCGRFSTRYRLDDSQLRNTPASALSDPRLARLVAAAELLRQARRRCSPPAS